MMKRSLWIVQIRWWRRFFETGCPTAFMFHWRWWGAGSRESECDSDSEGEDGVELPEE
jgi:hypothetical protein